MNHMSDGRWTAYSAGSHPTGAVHPGALRVLRENGLPTQGARSKSWDVFAAPDAPEMDLVITVCGKAAEETCPIWPGAPVRTHWGVEDPAAFPEDQQHQAFGKAFELLNLRAGMFSSLWDGTQPLQEMNTVLNQVGLTPLPQS